MSELLPWVPSEAGEGAGEREEEAVPDAVAAGAGAGAGAGIAVEPVSSWWCCIAGSHLLVVVQHVYRTPKFLSYGHMGLGMRVPSVHRVNSCDSGVIR